MKSALQIEKFILFKLFDLYSVFHVIKHLKALDQRLYVASEPRAFLCNVLLNSRDMPTPKKMLRSGIRTHDHADKQT